jgi:hypothetical protein
VTSINWNELAAQMGVAAEQVLKSDWAIISSSFAEEVQGYLMDVQNIQEMIADGTFTADEGKQIMSIEADSMKSVLLASQGLAKLAIEQAVDAALAVAASVINSALNFKLL